MNLSQRFTLMVKGNLNQLFDKLEDPERSLNQLILDMEEQLEAAKRAAAGAMANEDRLQTKVAFHHQEAEQWRQAAKQALGKAREDDARTALRRAEQAARQAQRLRRQLEAQSRDTEEVRQSVTLLHERLEHARSRLQLTQARLRQKQARQAAGRVMKSVSKANLYAEFERLEERVEVAAAEERAYLQLDDTLSHRDVRRRFEDQSIEDSVEDGLAVLRREMAQP